MTSESTVLSLHEDRELFLAAIEYTARDIEYSPELIEKDYFCSVVLERLSHLQCGLVFKGGTSLAKVHVGFYRMSEDLDFSMPIDSTATRARRRRAIAPAREALATITQEPGLQLASELEGSNKCRQYSAAIAYESRLDGEQRLIKVEIGLREPLLRSPVSGEVMTALHNPIATGPAVASFRFSCLAWEEALAEKFRAALSRREPAIRDFFDIDFALQRLLTRIEGADFLDLVKRKLALPEADPVDVSDTRLAALRLQLRSRLQPVLRPVDFDLFDLERAFAAVRQVAQSLDA